MSSTDAPGAADAGEVCGETVPGPGVPGTGGAVSLDSCVECISTRSPCVVVLLGPPGAGKSTLSAMLVEQLGRGAAALSYAAHRAEVSGDPADPAADPKAGALLQRRLVDRCAAGLTTIVDGVHHLARTRAALLAIAVDAGLPAVAVVLSTPLEVCLARQLDRPPPGPGKDHGLRIPEPQVRELGRAIHDAQAGLVREGFVVHVLEPHVTAPASRLASRSITLPALGGGPGRSPSSSGPGPLPE